MIFCINIVSFIRLCDPFGKSCIKKQYAKIKDSCKPQKYFATNFNAVHYLFALPVSFVKNTYLCRMWSLWFSA